MKSFDRFQNRKLAAIRTKQYLFRIVHDGAEIADRTGFFIGGTETYGIDAPRSVPRERRTSRRHNH
jgi:hypothetical protein